MIIEFQFKSVSIPLADMQDIYPGMFSVYQSNLPAPKTVRRRKLRKKKQTVAHLIQDLIDSINDGIGD
jgi:hypothetical protein